MDPVSIQRENEAFCPVADRLFLIDVLPETGLERIRTGRKQTPDRFEQAVYLERVRSIFRSLSVPGLILLDGTLLPERLHATILDETLRVWHGDHPGSGPRVEEA